jgi:hypothetical protein
VTGVEDKWECESSLHLHSPALHCPRWKVFSPAQNPGRSLPYRDRDVRGPTLCSTFSVTVGARGEGFLTRGSMPSKERCGSPLCQEAK